MVYQRDRALLFQVFLALFLLAAGEAAPEEAAEHYECWNDRAKLVLERADALDGFFSGTGL